MFPPPRMGRRFFCLVPGDHSGRSRRVKNELMVKDLNKKTQAGLTEDPRPAKFNVT